MFVQAQVAVPVAADRAAAALDRALADGGLVEESQRAQEAGLTYLMRVSPRRSYPMAKQVRVRALPMRRVADTSVVALRWEATGPAGPLFPTLDANLEVRDEGDPAACLLVLLGRYEPPLGPVGRALDRTLLADVAGATADTLLAAVRARVLALAGDAG